MKTRCKRGHVYTFTNTRFVTVRPQNGKLYRVRQCKQCRSALDALAYLNSPRRAAAIRHRAHIAYEESKS